MRAAVVSNVAEDVRAGEELDVAALARFLNVAEVGVKQFRGGHSNLTYLVTYGDHEGVLRRPPFGSTVKSAHDMGREVAVLSKLAPVYARAPKVLAFCDDAAVLGAPFYLMERRHGVILRKDLPLGTTLDAPGARHACDVLIDALVELHAVDYVAAGLGELGKPAGYIARQVKGWSERYAGSQTDDLPAMTELAAWLAAHQLPESGASLIHNDFKFDNVIFDPAIDHVTGVLDWEMATIGDPLMDLGTSLSYWAQADDDPGLLMFLFGPTTRPGMMTRAEVAARYLERSDRAGVTGAQLVFYYAFGLFKTAVIAQQIYYRFAKGLTKDARFAAMIHAVRGLSAQARATIDRGAI
jgi:aminoglycoside phosphotransferase (APT) family kinase protein